MKQIILNLVIMMGLQNMAFAALTAPVAENAKPRRSTVLKDPRVPRCGPCAEAADLISKFMALKIKPDPVNADTAKKQLAFVDAASKKLTELLAKAAKDEAYAESSLKTVLAAIPYDESGILNDMNSEDFVKAYNDKNKILAKKLQELVDRKIMTEAQKLSILQAMGLVANAADDGSRSAIAE